MMPLGGIEAIVQIFPWQIMMWRSNNRFGFGRPFHLPLFPRPCVHQAVTMLHARSILTLPAFSRLLRLHFDPVLNASRRNRLNLQEFYASSGLHLGGIPGACFVIIAKLVCRFGRVFSL
jgi:hypothetical protein